MNMTLINTRRNIFQHKFLLFGVIFCALVLIIAAVSVVVLTELDLYEDSAWSYEKQDKWPRLCKTGQLQSPIALSDTSATGFQPQALIFKHGKVQNVEITNTGHTVLMNLDKRNGRKPQLSGGGLPGKFTLSNFHFHWPSEHVKNGKRYDLESHLVFISDKFNNLEEALAVPFAVTVLATLYEKSDTIIQPNFEIVGEAVEEVSTEPGQTFATSASINVFEFLPENPETFFKYSGSLTTPNCTENINWIVFRETSTITTEEFQELTTINSESNEPLDFNNRQLQNINQRTISLRT